MLLQSGCNAAAMLNKGRFYLGVVVFLFFYVVAVLPLSTQGACVSLATLHAALYRVTIV